MIKVFLIIIIYRVYRILYIGENAIVIVSGANDFLTPEDVISSSNMIYSAKVVVCQLEVPIETTLKALEVGKNGGGIEMVDFVDI